ncbi:2,3-diaminopropionate biosynthesis protein SbnB [Paraherbaspirillum soli]|uniref:2,3-diaminopropionate biosynthesis protein SbnB n=1 Tax=Paraherbaspirillum soli TaxID=631222 RepID=A0ABW0M6H8_9BURK
MFDFHVIPGHVIKTLLDENAASVIASVQNAYLAHHQGATVNPDSYFLRYPDNPANRIIALPATINADVNVSGIKWIASFPKNIEQGIPRASAVLVLNDHQTGYPFALLECALISAARTAASAVLGAYWLNHNTRSVKQLSIIGAGVIARTILDTFVTDGWQIGEVLVHDTHPASASALMNHARDRHQLKASTVALDAALSSQVVVFATNAGTPYVSEPGAFRPGQVILNISLRDIGPDLIESAKNIFDDVDHCMKANTSPHLAELKFGHRQFVTGTLAQLIQGEIELDRSKPLIFSPFGMGMLDLALGKTLYDKAIAQGTAVAVPNFFGETTRW